MKTITNCFMRMTIEILWATLNMFSAISAYFHQSWWIMAFNIAVMILCIVGAVASYRRAKDYEETILAAIDNTLDIAMLAYTKALRMETEKLLAKAKELTKDKTDEMARNN